MKKSFEFTVIAILIVAGLALSGIAGKAGTFAYRALTEPSPVEIAKATSNELNKDVPLIIDKYTRLDKTIAISDGTLLYDYTVLNTSAQSITAPQINDLRHHVIQNTCSNRNLNLLKRNVALEFRYRDENRVLITDLIVKPNSCFVDPVSNEWSVLRS